MAIYKKKITLFALLSCVFLLPFHTVHAGGIPIAHPNATLQIPSNAVGINQDTYTTLANTIGCNSEKSGQPDSCSDVATKLNQHIVFLPTGEMYNFYLVGVGISDGILDRYLPDGLYRTQNTLYYVASNNKTELHKNNFLKTIQNRVEHNYPSRTPISEQDFTLLKTSIHQQDCATFTADSTEHTNCVAGYTLAHKLQGKLLMRTQKDGSLYYLTPSSWPELIRLTQNNKTFKNLKQPSSSIDISPTILEQVHSYQ